MELFCVTDSFTHLNKVTNAANLQLHLHPYLTKPRIAALWAER